MLNIEISPCQDIGCVLNTSDIILLFCFFMQIFATLSPIPGFMQWLLAKLASQIKLSEAESQEGNSLGTCSTFRESILLPDEERMIHDATYVPFSDNIRN